MEDGSLRSTVEREHESEDRAQFADRECGYEGKWIHAADVRLAVWNIHRSPWQAGSHRGQDAIYSMPRVTRIPVNRAEAKQHRSGYNCECSEHNLGDISPTRALQLTKENASPEDADERVCVPQRKCDRQANIADGKDSQSVGNRPQHAGQNRPDDEMFVLHQICDHVLGALQKGRKSPPGGKDTGHHAQRDRVRR
jgi:hypothetical protein